MDRPASIRLRDRAIWDRRVISWLRTLPGALTLGAVVSFVLYAIALFGHIGGPVGASLLANFGSLPTEAIGTSLVIVVVVREQRHRARLAWSLFAAAASANFAGHLVHGLDATFGTPSFPSLADAFYLPGYLFVIAGLVLLPSVIVASVLRWRLWTNILIVIIGGSMVVTNFALVPVFGRLDSDPLSAGLSLAYPIADLGLLAALGTVFTRQPFVGDRKAIALFSFAVIGWFFADLAFAVQSMGGGWTTSSGTDLLSVGGDLIIALAASTQLVYSRRPNASAAADMLPAARIAPYFMLSLGLGTLIIASFSPGHPLIGPLALMAVALVVLFVVRQMFEEYERRTVEARLLAEHVTAAEMLKVQAHHDVLTGLPNRLTMHERLTSEIAASKLTGRPVSLIFLDLNLFKEVNDTLGHLAGDRLLVAVAERLAKAVRGADTVARLGGDEFAIVAPGADAAGATALATNAKASLELPFDLDGAKVTISGAFGISIFPHGAAKDDIDLMRQADMAMYHAKRSHLEPTVFHPDLDTSGNLSILTELREAITGKGLRLLYQPWRHRVTGTLTVVEALVRWDHPTRGRLAPSDFLELASAAGLARQLDERVVELACAQAQVWRSEGLAVAISVNISPDTLQDATTAVRITDTIARAGLPTSAIELEITEEGMLRHQKQAALFVEHMRDAGVAMAIDDFGTGFSSLARLRDLRVNALKIDQQFVRNVLTEPDDATIVEAVVALGHRLGLQVIAEGVEDAATMEYLERLDVDFTQGYFISRPIEAAQASTLIRATGASARSV